MIFWIRVILFLETGDHSYSLANQSYPLNTLLLSSWIKRTIHWLTFSGNNNPSDAYRGLEHHWLQSYTHIHTVVVDVTFPTDSPRSRGISPLFLTTRPSLLPESERLRLTVKNPHEGHTSSKGRLGPQPTTPLLPVFNLGYYYNDEILWLFTEPDSATVEFFDYCYV